MSNVDCVADTCLNLGCGYDYREGWVNLDLSSFEGKCDIRCDLDKQALPFDNCFFDVVLASHVFEHIRDLPCLIDEIHRILKKTGELHIRVPHGGSDDAWEDPTHVRAFFPGSFAYYTEHLYDNAQTSSYVDRFWKVKQINCVPAPEFEKQSKDEIMKASKFMRNSILEIQAVLTPIHTL